MRNLIYESIDILLDEDTKTKGYDVEKIRTVLEDSYSPIVGKYKETLYSEIMEKAHIDFGDIPKSKGVISNYSGYSTILKTLEAIEKLAEENKSKDCLNYCNIVRKAIHNIENLSSTYQMGFSSKTEYVALEYNIYVYTCVECVTALLNTYIEYMRTPEHIEFPVMRNTKMRADSFYFEQLEKFNIIQDKMGIEYRQMLETLCNKGRNNFVGTSTLIGIGTVSAVALSIIPITRSLIYAIYNLRVNISESLKLQAHFLELNAESIEKGYSNLKDSKKDKVVKKQKNLVQFMNRLSDKLRVDSAKAIDKSKKELRDKNKKISLDSLKDSASEGDPSDIILL